MKDENPKGKVKFLKGGEFHKGGGEFPRNFDPLGGEIGGGRNSLDTASSLASVMTANPTMVLMTWYKEGSYIFLLLVRIHETEIYQTKKIIRNCPTAHINAYGLIFDSLTVILRQALGIFPSL
jgi:hypothetical protein